MKKIKTKITKCNLTKCKWNSGWSEQCLKFKIEIDTAGKCNEIFIENPRYAPGEMPNYMKDKGK
jgi:hypothetical protein